jgi:ankyrin repeat protein
VITFLLNVAKVRPDPKDRWQRTPYHDAKAENHMECIRLLEKAMTLNEHSEVSIKIPQYLNNFIIVGRGQWSHFTDLP